MKHWINKYRNGIVFVNEYDSYLETVYMGRTSKNGLYDMCDYIVDSWGNEYRTDEELSGFIEEECYIRYIPEDFE